MDIDALRALIGQTVVYRDSTCIIIEVLEDLPALVLQPTEPAEAIQPDQLGEAHRRAPRTFTVVLDPDDDTAGGLELSEPLSRPTA